MNPQIWNPIEGLPTIQIVANVYIMQSPSEVFRHIGESGSGYRTIPSQTQHIRKLWNNIHLCKYKILAQSYLRISDWETLV